MEETPITDQNEGEAEFESAEEGAEENEEEIALRWRSVILRLSENLMNAADERSELSPILMGALHNALDQLLLHGDEGDLMALEEWLMMEDSSLFNHSEIVVPPPTHPWPGPERRVGAERRAGCERRALAERRCQS